MTVRARLLLVGALAWCVACEHAQPFGGANLGPNAPLSDVFPRQLTFNARADVTPAWLPDGSGIIYTFELDRSDHDRCLGILPADGGHQVRVVCHVPAAFDADSTDVLSNPAVGPGGALAYLRESSPVGAVAPRRRDLVVASLDHPDPGRVVLTFPYTAPDGQIHASLSHLRWLDAHTLVYRADSVAYTNNPVDTTVTPLEVVRLSLVGDAAAVAVVPGTAHATSVAPGGGDTVVVTVLGDSIVYAIDLASGLRSVLYSFRALGAVSDAQIAGNHLMVLAGGVTATQLAGQVYDVDLVSRTAQPLDSVQDVLFRIPALSPTGGRVVAEGHVIQRYTLFDGGPIITVVTKGSDLWLLRAP